MTKQPLIKLLNYIHEAGCNWGNLLTPKHDIGWGNCLSRPLNEWELAGLLITSILEMIDK